MELMTELDAVNVMLEMIGEQPVQSIDPSELSEATIARNLLRQTTRSVQSTGLVCNTERRYPLQRSSVLEMPVPEDAHVIGASDQCTPVVQRGRRLYNLYTHSYQFEVPTLEVDIILNLGFEDLPYDVRYYTTVKAARKFIKSILGSDTLAKLTEEDEVRAKIDMEANEAARLNGNYLRSNPTPNNVMRRRTVLGRI